MSGGISDKSPTEEFHGSFHDSNDSVNKPMDIVLILKILSREELF